MIATDQFCVSFSCPEYCRLHFSLEPALPSKPNRVNSRSKMFFLSFGLSKWCMTHVMASNNIYYLCCDEVVHDYSQILIYWLALFKWTSKSMEPILKLVVSRKKACSHIFNVDALGMRRKACARIFSQCSSICMWLQLLYWFQNISMAGSLSWEIQNNKK